MTYKPKNYPRDNGAVAADDGDCCAYKNRRIAQVLCIAPMRFMFKGFYRQRRAFLIAPKVSRRKQARQPALRPKGQSVPKRNSWA